MKRTHVLALGALVAVILVACGGEAPPANTPRSERASPPESPSSGRNYADSGGAPHDAWFEFQTAHGELDATTSDCALACKALGSMDRAAGEVCAIAPDADHCAGAKDTVKNARKRVRAQCTMCPNGASVDPDAPIPAAPATQKTP